MAIKKYTNGSWVSASFRKYGTETDTITMLPATVIGDGTPISSYTIKGNMEQSGTPTPSSPIYPSECGEKTENLFDKDNYNLIRANAGAGMNILYGNPIESPYAVYIPVTGGETYSFYSQAALHSSCFTMVPPAIGVSIVVNGANTFGDKKVRTAPADAKYLVIFLELSSVTQDKLDFDLATLTIVKSSPVPTTYIPYGYKLPLTLGDTTTNIYLGEVQSTRRIKKLVLTGEEIWTPSSVYHGSCFAYLKDIASDAKVKSSIVCTHVDQQSGQYHYGQGRIDENSLSLWLFDSSVSAQTFKSYLAQQYANGTPVTVWHILAEPTTGIVNEPIRKIGGYVDSVSGTGLATSGTAQQFDVGTTLKPSEVDLTYHGWHEHEDTKYST